MLIETKKGKDLTPISYKVDTDLVKEFRSLCKIHKISQVAVIKNAMKKAIEEMKNLKE